MRFLGLEISNFRAIESLSLATNGQFVVIAGSNGCGKTTVLDAIRLLKSAYVVEEWKRWFQEFGINPDRATRFPSMLRDSTSPARIQAQIELSSGESEFLQENAQNIGLSLQLASNPQSNVLIDGRPPIVPPSIQGDERDQLIEKAASFEKSLVEQLSRGRVFDAGVLLSMPPNISAVPSPVATASFNCFRPDFLGEIEFHGSRRLFARQEVNQIRLNVADRSEERKSRFLYDLDNKYRNIKAQLGEEYVQSVLRERDPAEGPLQTSIRDLFRAFIPGKEFEGVVAQEDGSLAFPVRLDSGEVHDIDELSSGEKEIVYGYVWLRTGTPRNSVVLIDEPELHLNPALVQGLPDFYRANISDELECQVWVITHSDAILRQAVKSPHMLVYHLARAGRGLGNQASQINSRDEVEVAVIDLIGDLAAYRPFSKIVLVEGNRDTQFDVDVIHRLFPDLFEVANFLSVGNRRMTSGIRRGLSDVLTASGLSGRVVSISDGDFGFAFESESDSEHLSWPVYEIENFLLDDSVLEVVVSRFLGANPFKGSRTVEGDLRAAAVEMLPRLSAMKLQRELNGQLVDCVKIGGGGDDPAGELWRSVSSSMDRLADLDFSESHVRDRFLNLSTELDKQVSDGSFRWTFPGERLLNSFAGMHGINAVHLRNACLDEAQTKGLRPVGMEETLRRALGLSRD